MYILNIQVKSKALSLTIKSNLIVNITQKHLAPHLEKGYGEKKWSMRQKQTNKKTPQLYYFIIWSRIHLACVLTAIICTPPMKFPSNEATSLPPIRKPIWTPSQTSTWWKMISSSIREGVQRRSSSSWTHRQGSGNRSQRNLLMFFISFF